MKTSIKIASVLAFALGAACTTEIGDINRVQPNYVTKDLFKGEWYYMQTVTGVQYTQIMASPGETGPLEKITWEITPGMLIAYRTWDYIPGSVDKSQSAVRSPVAAFLISKHFNIQRGYNSVTGQQNNVLGENAEDKPWWERKFMRVDWSRNLIDDLGINTPDFLPLTSMSPASYDVETHEDRDPNHPILGENYIDITTRFLAQPDSSACYVLAEYEEWCGPSTLTVRSSFRKIDPTNDYEPWDYRDSSPIPVDTNGDLKDDDVVRWSWEDEPCDMINDPENCYEIRVPLFERFGYFRTEKLTYDKNRGVTLTGRQFLINRFNIWKKSFDAAGASIPLAQREPKPVTFYLSVNFPTDVVGAAQMIADDYNKALLDTVKGVGVPAAKIPARMFELHVNDCNADSVKAFVKKFPSLKPHLASFDLDFAGGSTQLSEGNLESVCSVLEYHSGADKYADGSDKPAKEAFVWEKIGDLRFNQLVWHTKPIAMPSYSGLAQLNADPETGEIVQANAIVAGYLFDRYAARWLEYLDLIDGKLTQDDVAVGEHISRTLWQRRMERDQRYKRAYGPQTLQKLGERLKGMGDSRRVEQAGDVGAERLKAVRGTSLEREFLMTDEIKRGLAGNGWRPGEPMTAAQVKNASPATWGTSEAWRTNNTRRTLLESGRAIRSREHKVDGLTLQGRPITSVYEPLAMVDDAIAGLALKVKDMPIEQAKLLIKQQTYRAIAGHEVGHVMGLRHNFEASYDALNWDDEFWHVDSLPADVDAALAKTDDELAYKDLDSTVLKPGSVYRTELEQCKAKLAAVTPTFSLKTQDCLDNQTRMYASIMDYHRKMNSDWDGIGKYDRAAIKFGYGKLLEVFDESAGKFVPRDDDLDSYIGSRGRFDYKDWGKILSGVPEYIDGQRAYDYDRDYGKLLETDWKAYQTATDQRQNIRKRKLITLDQYFAQRRAAYQTTNIVDRRNTGDVAVPYKFCPDDYADWSLTCQRSDLGGNMREIIGNIIDDYDFYYPFRNFKRDRFGWGEDVSGYMQTLWEGTFQPLKNMFRYFFFYADYFQWAPAAKYPQTEDWTSASNVGLNFITEVLQTPEPGKYCKVGAEYVRSATGDCSGNPEATVPFIQGKYYDMTYSNEYYYKPARIGVIYDKLLALQALTDSQAFFYRDANSYLNRRAFSISYYRLYREEMLKLFESLIFGAGRGVQGRIVQDAQRDGGNNIVLGLDGKPVGVPGTERFLPNLIVEEPSSVDYAEVAPVSSKGMYSYTLRYYSLLYGLAYMTSLVDSRLDFSKYVKVALDGTPEALEYGKVDELTWLGDGDAMYPEHCNVAGECDRFDVRDTAAVAALQAKGVDTGTALNPPTGPVQNDVYLEVQRYNQDNEALPKEKYLVTGISGSLVTLRTTFAASENTNGYMETPFAQDSDLAYTLHVLRGPKTTTLVDPFSRYAYTAAYLEPNKDRRPEEPETLGISAHMLDRAKDLAADYQLKKAAYDAAPTLGKPAALVPMQEALTKLQDALELVDTVRAFYLFYEFGLDYAGINRTVDEGDQHQ